MIYSQRIGHYIPSLGIDDSSYEEDDEKDRGRPPACRVRCPLVQHQLVRLAKALEEGENDAGPLPEDIFSRILHHFLQTKI